MSVVLVKFDEAISDADGGLHLAQAVGRQREDGLWEGWLEFLPMKGTDKRLCSERETTQPNRNDLDYWAQGLSRVYLQGALVRSEPCGEDVQDHRTGTR
jgi:hypothetical protein